MRRLEPSCYQEREDGDELFMLHNDDHEGEEFPSGDTVAAWMTVWCIFGALALCGIGALALELLKP